MPGNVPGVHVFGTLGTLLPTIRSRCPCFGDTGNTLSVMVCKVVLKVGHLARFWGYNVQGGVKSGTPCTLLRGFNVCILR